MDAIITGSKERMQFTVEAKSANGMIYPDFKDLRAKLSQQEIGTGNNQKYILRCDTGTSFPNKNAIGQRQHCLLIIN